MVLDHILNVGRQSVAQDAFYDLAKARIGHDEGSFAPRIDTDASENGRVGRAKMQKHGVVLGAGKDNRRGE